ncbi:hypothetical protein [Streptomyces sp. NBC_00083]|uniref:hypothetical protein n=1 Tax=Streptomyces sp. NBC_00083 TaxID=2975647 RepID=UPI002254C52F|nr:hypothetical protein [Streptomyces sp. NBC_00083]MCX5386873.1 hypothetical protein [Streptomyces sp. NBC_00083]
MTADRYAVRVLEFGRADVRGPEVFWMRHWDAWVTLSFSVVLIRNASRCMLVNAGMSRADPELDRLWEQYSGHPRARMRLGTSVRDQLRALGIGPEAVTDVILSPFQAYSLSDVREFPRATVHLLRSGWAEFLAPSHSHVVDQTQAHELSVPRDVVEYVLFDARNRVHLLDDQDVIAPGVTSVAVGVHHPESLAVTISTRNGPVVWTDGIFHHENFSRRTPLGLTRSLAESSRLQEFLENSGAAVLPAYDATLTERHAHGVVAE